MRGYRLEDIENVDTDQGCRGYRSESGYRSGTGIDLSSTYIQVLHMSHIHLPWQNWQENKKLFLLQCIFYPIPEQKETEDRYLGPC